MKSYPFPFLNTSNSHSQIKRKMKKTEKWKRNMQVFHDFSEFKPWVWVNCSQSIVSCLHPSLIIVPTPREIETLTLYYGSCDYRSTTRKSTMNFINILQTSVLVAKRYKYHTKMSKDDSNCKYYCSLTVTG